MLKIGVMVSGGGTNLQAIINKIDSGYLHNCRIVTVVSSRKDAFALSRAQEKGIPASCIRGADYGTIEEFDKALIDHFEKYEVDLIVMAGYLAMVGQGFVSHYKNRIINVHPSLIPSFCGKGYYGIVPHQKALEYGVKITGATVHFVEFDYDSGPVILQKAVEIKEGDTPEVLQRRVMEEAEWEILPEAIRLIAEKRVRVEGRMVKIERDYIDIDQMLLEDDEFNFITGGRFLRK
ncbi:MAG: phosphoribosylglycinamide formyltransferase [Clostridiales bacterium]|nr:phosphoribosylglycinamide formyltransferase [Clostridiales bacterium]